jgi:hypothetical protein
MEFFESQLSEENPIGLQKGLQKELLLNKNRFNK